MDLLDADDITGKKNIQDWQNLFDAQNKQSEPMQTKLKKPQKELIQNKSSKEPN